MHVEIEFFCCNMFQQSMLHSIAIDIRPQRGASLRLASRPAARFILLATHFKPRKTNDTNPIMHNYLKITISTLLLSSAAHGQGTLGSGTFQNLDFETANPQVSPVGGVTFASAFAGWNGSIAGIAQIAAAYNEISLGSAVIILLGPHSLTPIIDGAYSVELTSSTSPTSRDVSISQVGILPAGAQSIQMKVNSIQGGPFIVKIAASTIQMTALAVTPSYTLYGGDIGMFAGKSEQLSITDPATSPTGQRDILFGSVAQFVGSLR